MKTLAKTLLITLTISAFTLVATVPVSAGVPKLPRRTATYQVGVYGSVDGTKLNIAIDKQTGGRVEILLKDEKGTLFFQQLLRSGDEKYRGKLDVSSLAAGTYKLEISNGKETTVRSLTIADREPTESVRTIAML